MLPRTIAHYEVLEQLGAGGMGIVHKAQDTRLGRLVALKMLLPDRVWDPERKRRFVQEAKSASALNHPNIITIYEIGEATNAPGAPSYIAMEYVAGKTLAAMIAPAGLPVDEALGYAVQITGALAAAHAAGLVHRDLKPGNIMVTQVPPAQGLVKVLDFGLAKLTEPSLPGGESATTQTLAPQTREGAIVGTIAYMSPEQAEGKRVDARSDVFSLGIVLYEMVAGARPSRSDPAPLNKARPGVPAELDHVIRRCLQKTPELRYPSAIELHRDLVRLKSRRDSPGLWGTMRRPRFAVPALILLAALATLSSWYLVRSERVRKARNETLPEIARQVEAGRGDAAFRLALEIQSLLPDDPQLQRLLRDATAPVSVRTVPPGAEVRVKGYLSGADWYLVGRTPLEGVRVPTGYNRWKISKEGYQPAEAAFPGAPGLNLSLVLDSLAAAPAGMVRIPGGRYQFRSAPPVELEDFWLDKYEVTNRQFKEFIDAGGYEKRELWKHPFVKDRRVEPWEDAMREFRDTTGRPGPSTWELGTYPEAQAEFPVSGVSWHEAAAYCEFAGKSLPTVFHWYRAAGIYVFSDILKVSNFGSRGVAPVGAFQGVSAYGNYDMAGNVKEWCLNQTGERRYILGGAWNEPDYMYQAQDAAPPFARTGNFGFRCAKYAAPLPVTLLGPVENLARDYSREKPAAEDAFRIYRGLYAYDRTELDAKVESVDDANPHWRREKITFNAAYGGERILSYLFLPKNARAPYQAVIYFPGSTALRLRSSENLAEARFWDFIVRSGRALLFPVYKGTYERRLPGQDPKFEDFFVKPGGSALHFGPNVVRDLVLQWARDLGRSVDYLETRQDIDATRLAYHGLSLGAVWAPVLTAVEPRFKASVLMGGGFIFEELPPEIDAVHFAPRVKTPTLMLNGRNDFVYPVESSQLPLYRLLGVPENDKRHVLFDSGHVPPREGVIKETLDWLDRYLGRVATPASSAPPAPPRQ